MRNCELEERKQAHGKRADSAVTQLEHQTLLKEESTDTSTFVEVEKLFSLF